MIPVAYFAKLTLRTGRRNFFAKPEENFRSNGCSPENSAAILIPPPSIFALAPGGKSRHNIAY
jgi:hypothetical protein